MPEPRNNIYRHWPRAAKLQLVRWREIDGIPQGKVIERATAQWPDLPKIHSTTWQGWQHSAEYRELRELVTGEQRQREELSELFQAAGGAGALGDVSRAAAYSLAAKAMRIAENAEDAREVRSLMATAMDAGRMAADEVDADWRRRFEAAENEHAAEEAALTARISELEDALQAATGSRTVDAAAVAARMNEVLGVKK